MCLQQGNEGSVAEGLGHRIKYGGRALKSRSDHYAGVVSR